MNCKSVKFLVKGDGHFERFQYIITAVKIAELGKLAFSEY